MMMRFLSVTFQFQTGSIKSGKCAPPIKIEFSRFNSKLVRLKDKKNFLELTLLDRFNSKLVRLKGSPKTTLILYYTLTVPVKLIFIFIKLESSLLSTSNRANSLGG